MSDNDDEFHWDYSYFKWQDIPRHVRRQMIFDASQLGRTWMYGRTYVVADIFKCDARKMYNKNWDGCRDLWKESYRQRKLLRLIDRPIVPSDPRIVKYEQEQRERRQAEADRFNRAQQKPLRSMACSAKEQKGSLESH